MTGSQIAIGKGARAVGRDDVAGNVYYINSPVDQP